MSPARTPVPTRAGRAGLAAAVAVLAVAGCAGPGPGSARSAGPVATASSTDAARPARPAPTTLAPTTAPPAGPSTGPGPVAGPAAPARTCSTFPADNWWNTPVVDLPVHERSDAWVAAIGDEGLHPDFGTVWEGEPNGIPFNDVTGPTTATDVAFDYADESDPGPYPVPEDPAIEAGDDAHLLVVDHTTCTLYELYDVRHGAGGLEAGSGAVFDLGTNDLRPDTWTSADAAGLPIFPGLVRYDEVASGEIDHALRFTAEETGRGFIHPATHWASDDDDPDLPPMGARFRLRSDVDCSSLSADAAVICTALQTYGMFLADNGGNWFVSGAPDPRWDDEVLHELSDIPGSAFEVVDTGEPIVTP